MARKDALLRLTQRLMARRDALRKALNGDLDSFRKFSELNAVGDNVDAAVDCANDEICSQLVEIESRELGQIEHALQRIAGGVYGRCEYCGGKIAEPRLNALPVYEQLHRLPARERASGSDARARAGIEAVGESLRKAARRCRRRFQDQPERLRNGFQRDRPLRERPTVAVTIVCPQAAGSNPAVFFVTLLENLSRRSCHLFAIACVHDQPFADQPANNSPDL